MLPLHADDVDAKTYYDHMRTLSTMGTFFCLADMLTELTKLSKWFQKASVNFSEIPAMINNMKNKFTQMYGIDMSYGEAASLLHFDPKSFLETRCTMGFFFQQFWSGVAPSQFSKYDVSYEGGSLSFDLIAPSTAVQLTRLAEGIYDFARFVVMNLEARFPTETLDFWSAAAILDPGMLPQTRAELMPNIYGHDEIEFLGKFYDVAKSKETGVELTELKEQWARFVCLFYDRTTRARREIELMKQHAVLTGEIFPQPTLLWTVWQDLLGMEIMELEFPAVVRVLRNVLVIPLSSVECERGFSRMALVRTKIRNRLKSSTLDVLLRVLCEGPSEHLSNEQLEEVAKIWARMRAYRHILSRKGGEHMHGAKTKKRKLRGSTSEADRQADIAIVAQETDDIDNVFATDEDLREAALLNFENLFDSDGGFLDDIDFLDAADLTPQCTAAELGLTEEAVNGFVDKYMQMHEQRQAE